MLLKDFGFSQSLVDDILSFLGSRATTLEATQPEGVGASFGAAPASKLCASDAGKARDHVLTAITDMVAGLEQFATNINDMARRASEVEDVTEIDLKKKFDAAQACAAPTFSSPSQCTVPGNSSEEG